MLRGVASALLLALGTCAAEEVPSPQDRTIQVQSLVSEAGHEVQLGHLAEARRLCERALELEPGNQAAQHELDEVEGIIAGRSTTAVPAESHPASIELRRQETMTEARVAADQAELLAAEGRNAEAAQRLEPAIDGMLEIRQYLSPEQVQELVRLQDVDARLRTAATEDANRGARDARTGALVDARGQAQHQQHADRSVYQERFDRVQRIRSNRHLEVALNEARRLMTDYPAEPSAEKLFRDVLAEVHIQRRLDLKASREELMEETRETIELSIIPQGIDGMPVFPKDFLTRRKDLSGFEGVEVEPAWQTALREQLSKRVTVNLNGDNGVDALLAISHSNAINLVIDPQLQTADQHPVTLKLANAEISHIFDFITAQMGTTYHLADGAIYVGGKDQPAAETKIYNVSGLVFAHRATYGGTHHRLPAPGGGGGQQSGMSLFKTRA